MALDLYRDELVPAPTSRKSSGSGYGWLSLILLVIIGILAAVMFIQPGQDDDDDGMKPPIASGLHVLVVEESADRDELPADQAAIFTSIPLREWLAANCAKEGDQPAYRFFDKDDKLGKESQVWRDLRERITIDPPAYLVINGKRGEQGKLPKDPESFQTVLEKFKGK